MTATLLVGSYLDAKRQDAGEPAGLIYADFAVGGIGGMRWLVGLDRPSWWFTTSDDDRFVYVVHDDPAGGRLLAYARAAGSGELTLLGAVPTGGNEPAHVEIAPGGAFVLVANFRSGSVSVVRRDASGRLGDTVDVVRCGDADGFPESHPHQIAFDPVTGSVMVPDLGADVMRTYLLSGTGRLEEMPEFAVRCAPGSGPRHLAFHPDGRHAFLLCERNSTLMVLQRGGDGFVPTQVTSTLPDGFSGSNLTSAVRVSPTGSHVYCSNRGHDSIAIFQFQRDAARVEMRGIEPSGGRKPRDMIVSPDGSRLLVGNQGSDTIVEFELDEEMSSLRPLASVEIPTPVCLRFVT